MSVHAEPDDWVGREQAAGSSGGRPAGDDSPDLAAEVGTDGGVAAASPGPDQLDVETLVSTLEAVTAERDSHLADLQRLTAEFANFRRQATKRQSDTIAHAATGLVEKLLPVLDACDAALQQGASDVEPIQHALVDSLRKEGLEVLTDIGAPFDPERHEAVAHEEGNGGEPVVAEIMRSGYAWNGRILRPAMVRVQS